MQKRVALIGSMQNVTRVVLMLLVLSVTGLGILAAQAAPDAVEDTFNLLNNEQQIVNVLANDSPGVSVSVFDATTSIGSAITDNGNGSLLIASANGYIGTATFAYMITDGTGQADTALVTLNYSDPLPPASPPPGLPVDPPVVPPPSIVDAVDDYYTMPYNSTYFRVGMNGLLINDTPGVTIVSSDTSGTAGGVYGVGADGGWNLLDPTVLRQHYLHLHRSGQHGRAGHRDGYAGIRNPAATAGGGG